MESMGVASGCSFCSFFLMLFVYTMGMNNNCSLAGYMFEEPSIIIRLSCLLYVFKYSN